MFLSSSPLQNLTKKSSFIAPFQQANHNLKGYHNARILEAHLDHQRQISATLEELDGQDSDYQTSLDAIDPNICAWDGPPSIAVLQPRPYRQKLPSRSDETVLAPPSIFLNRDEPPNISQFGSSKQRDAWTLSRLTGSSLPSTKPSPQYTKYGILSSRPSNPPDLRCENYEIWDKVHKKNLETGGRDLEWKTGVVDLKIEAESLQDYANWVRECRDDLRMEGAMIKEEK